MPYTQLRARFALRRSAWRRWITKNTSWAASATLACATPRRQSVRHTNAKCFSYSAWNDGTDTSPSGASLGKSAVAEEIIRILLWQGTAGFVLKNEFQPERGSAGDDGRQVHALTVNLEGAPPEQYGGRAE